MEPDRQAADLQRRLQVSARRVARAGAADPQQGHGGPVWRTWGTVTAVHLGPPVTVDLAANGADWPGVAVVAYYTPAVDDVVVVDVTNRDALVVGPKGGAEGAPQGHPGVNLYASGPGLTAGSDVLFPGAADGWLAVIHNSTSGLSYLSARSNGGWLSVQIT